jgi:uncharacterized protein DUF4412
MKTLALSFAVLVLATTFATADWVLVQKTDADGKESQVITKVKGDQARVDMGDKMSVILGADGMTMLMHAQKMMIKRDLATMKAMLDKMKEGLADKQSAAKPVTTGQKEKVGEWDTEIYTWEGKMGKGRFWVAKDFPKHKEISAVSDRLGKLMGGSMSALSPQAADFDGMVVKSEVTMMGKSVISSLVSAKEEEVDAKEFVPPQDYNEMKLPSAPK